MTKKIESIQGLRAILFFLILSFHCGIGNCGSFAVSGFVIISGFVMIQRTNIRGGGEHFNCNKRIISENKKTLSYTFIYDVASSDL